MPAAQATAGRTVSTVRAAFQVVEIAVAGATLSDAATLRVYRDRYREGIPRRPIADEETDARIIYRVLAAIGGRELVGTSPELDSGTFYHAIPGD